MGITRSDNKIVAILLFHLFFVLNKHGIIVEGVKVPPFDIKPEALKKFMNFKGDIELNVPAIYAFGDSYIDSGNTVILNKMPYDILPYGIDFNHSLPNYGRATNGRTMLDFLAQVVGLPFPSTYLAMSDAEKKSTRTGINFASSFSGILPNTSSPTRKVWSLDKQIDYFEKTIDNLKSQFKCTKGFHNHMSKSLFVISSGNNDFGFSLDVVYSYKWHNKLPSFAKHVVRKLSKQLKRLYKLGARKFLINKVTPMGCTPFVAKQSHACNEMRNELVSYYNARLRHELPRLQSKHQGFQYTLGDIYKVMMDAIQKPNVYGFTNTLDSCCFHCEPKDPFCNDRNACVYFDIAHITEAMHFLVIKRYFTEPSLCTPISPIQLIQA
ncbi:hypothetical protein ACFE04_026325 [Oxalis oulophora]